VTHGSSAHEAGQEVAPTVEAADSVGTFSVDIPWEVKHSRRQEWLQMPSELCSWWYQRLSGNLLSADT
jgi:hypothetical protein